MISILQRYIAKSVLVATLLVITIVTGLAFFINLLGELKDIGVGDYGFMQAIIHTFLRLPHSLYQFFPMLVLVGGVMGLGVLSSNRELIVMRASGVSINQVIASVVIAALILILFATFLGEYVAPQSNFLADKRKDSQQNFGQAVATASGVWIHEGNNFLHIDKVNGLEHLEGVTRYEFNAQHQLLATYHAKFLNYNKNSWELQDVVKTSFMNDRTISQRMKKGTWNLVLNPNLLNVGIIVPEEMSLRALARYSNHLVENKSQASSFQFEFWKRVFQPLMTLVMILLAIPFVFAAPRSVTMGWRIVFGVMVGFVFYILNALLGQFSVVFQVSPFFSALLPTMLFAVIGYILLWRIR
jgi:lipopolysaccharide export system permease protein